MSFSKISAIAATLVAVHSFASTNAEPLPATVTEAPTATIAPRQVAGAPGTPILSTLHYAFTALPEQVYPFPVLRGPQFGFNICNSTTEGQGSNCQTLSFNGPDDFCLWGSPDANGEIGNVEAKVVAYCTKPGHGTRVIPAGMITGLQWVKTSAYIQVSGFIKNAGLSLDPTDEGGELDPHGADLQGSPLGGVVFSTGTPDSDGTTPAQVFNWNTFVGGGQFCFKACFNSITSPDYCENRYDLIGCDYNMPSAVQDGTFTACDSDLQDVVGVYKGSDGITSTWSMPDPLNTPPPYQPRVPASSSCQTFSSEELFSGAASIAPLNPASGSAAASTPAITSGSASASASASGVPSAPASASTSGPQASLPPKSTVVLSSSTASPSPTQTGSSPSSAFNIRVPSFLLVSLTVVAAGAFGVLL